MTSSASCRSIAPLLDTFLDGELPTDRVVEVDQHIASCPTCLARVRLGQALRTSTREVVRSAVEVTPAFEARVRHALQAVAERERQHSARRTPSRALPWGSIVPLAAAAAFTLLWGASMSERREPQVAQKQPAVAVASLTEGIEQFIDELVTHHVRGDKEAPAVVEPELLRQLEPEVGVPLRAPSLHEYGARWEGAAVVPVSNQDRRAAVLRYRLGSHRVTVYVYDASRYPLRARLEPRVVRDVPIYVGERRGYSIAASERAGVGYAAATDLRNDETAELVAAAFP